MLSRVRSLALLTLTALACAQQTQDSKPYVFKSQTNLVTVLATVRDRDGHILSKLNQDDFRIEEDGRLQSIKYFSRETDLPLTLGILVDTSNSQRRLLGEERSSSLQFLQSIMREDRDKAFVLHFDSDLELLQDLTSSRQKLNTALEEVEQTQDTDSGGGGGRGGWGGQQHRHNSGSTSLYDAVYVSADEVLNHTKGRKALVLLTDGVDTSSRVTLDRAIQQCIEHDTMVYSILFADESAYGQRGITIGNGGRWGGRRGGWGGPPMGGGGGRFPGGAGGGSHDGKRVLQQLAQQTGGRFFEVSKKESLNDIYREIEEELRNQYNLGYTPEPRTAGLHHIRVTTGNSNYRVVARDSYYAGEGQDKSVASR